MAKVNNIKINGTTRYIENISYQTALPTATNDSADFVSVNNELYAKQVNNGVYSYAKVGGDGGVKVIEKTLNEDRTGFVEPFTMEELLAFINDGSVLKAMLYDNAFYYLTRVFVGQIDDGIGVVLSGLANLETFETGVMLVATITMNMSEEINATVKITKGNAQGVELAGVPPTATNGILSVDELMLLQYNDSNYIMFNNEKYYLNDKGHTEGYLSYSHVGVVSEDIFVKVITITISTRGWVLVEKNVNEPEPPITLVDTLPEANEENFEKGKIYSTGALLQYISKAISENLNISTPSAWSSNYKYKTASAIVNNYLYIFGGSSNNSQTSFASSNTNQIIKINLSTYESTTISTVLPSAASGISAVPVDNYIYLFGVNSTAVYKFNTLDDTISSVGISTIAKAGMSAIKYKQFIYIFGGTTSPSSADSNINSIQKVDTQNDTITTLSITLPSKRMSSGITIVGDNIYIIAGYNNSSATASDTIYIFNATTETISTSSKKLPYSAIFVLCFADGENVFATYNPYIYKFNLKENTITQFARFVSDANSLLSSIASNSKKAFVLGGVGNLFQLIEFGVEYSFKTLATE